MSPNVCIGPEFTTDSSSRLALANLPTVAWPFDTALTGGTVASSMQAGNGLRVDPQGGPWIPQVGATPVYQLTQTRDSTVLAFGSALTNVYEQVLTPWYLTNPSAYQQMAFTGWVEYGMALYTSGSTWVEHWGNAAFAASPRAVPGATPWGPVASESPSVNTNFSFVWHSAAQIPVQMVVDIADQQPITVRHGVRATAGSGAPAQLRDWWVALYGMTYLLDPGPVG